MVLISVILVNLLPLPFLPGFLISDLEMAGNSNT